MITSQFGTVTSFVSPMHWHFEQTTKDIISKLAITLRAIWMPHGLRYNVTPVGLQYRERRL